MNALRDQITIAVTVYSRRQYISQAVHSALNQTVPARVMVVEDCGPDPELESVVRKEFGSRIKYIRNPKRRGLFGNWNACLELCETEWITILHDDDYLAPNYIQAMEELAAKAPGRFLYLGRTILVGENGAVCSEEQQDDRVVTSDWVQRDLRDILVGPFLFPGHLFHVPTALRLGGFRAASYMAGDWEMWAKLMALSGAAQSSQVAAYCRIHMGWDRGSNRAVREGRLLPSNFICRKRIIRLFPPDQRMRFDRRALQKLSPVSVRSLLRFGSEMSPRMFRYHVGLLVLSKAPHFGYALFQQCARLGGVWFVRWMSKIWNRLDPHP
jgi:glycosyltransferase involved in cell wall biosynthesis